MALSFQLEGKQNREPWVQWFLCHAFKCTFKIKWYPSQNTAEFRTLFFLLSLYMNKPPTGTWLLGGRSPGVSSPFLAPKPPRFACVTLLLMPQQAGCSVKNRLCSGGKSPILRETTNLPFCWRRWGWGGNGARTYTCPDRIWSSFGEYVLRDLTPLLPPSPPGSSALLPSHITWN